MGVIPIRGGKRVKKFKKVNRVEVIDHTKLFNEGGGRAYTKWQDGITVWYDLQDDNRTLKIFIDKGVSTKSHKRKKDVTE